MQKLYSICRIKGGIKVFDAENIHPIASVTDTVGPAAKLRERRKEGCTTTTRHTFTTDPPISLKLRRCLGWDATLDNLDDP